MFSSFGVSGDQTKMKFGMSKAVYYKQNGGGRDSYISVNNGGLNIPRDPNYRDVGKKSELLFIGTFYSKSRTRTIAPTI